MNHLNDCDRARARAYIEARSIPIPMAGCRLWLLSLRSTGYGAATFNGEQWDAHCLAFEAFVGPIPDGMLIQHSCDRRWCSEWSHLSPGTIATNMADAARKFRLGQKLTPEQVREIRARYAGGGVSTYQLADLYAVGKTAIHNIVRGKIWRSA